MYIRSSLSGICLLLFALLVFDTSVRGQGFETFPELYNDQSAGGLPDFIPLPDKSLYFSIGNTLGRLSEEGESIWNKVVYADDYYVGIDTVGNNLWVAGLRHLEEEIYLVEYELNSEGNVQAERSTLLDTLDALGELAHRDAIIRRRSNGTLVCFYGTDGAADRNGPRLRANTFVVELDADRNATSRARIDAGEEVEVINADLAADGSFILIANADTVRDGSYTRGGEATSVLQVYPSGSFERLAFLNTYANRTSIARTGPSQFAIPDVDNDFDLFSRPQLIRYFDLETGMSTQQRLLFPAEGDGTALLHSVGNQGQLVLMQRDNYWPERNKNFVRVKGIAANREILFDEPIEMPNVENLPFAIGAYADGDLYIFTIALLSEIGTQFLITDSVARTFPQEIQGVLRPAMPDSCQPDESRPGLGDNWLQIRPTQPGRDTLYAYTEPDGYFRTRLDTGDYELAVIRRNAYWENCPPIPFRIEPAVDTTILAPTLREVYACPLLSVSIAGEGELNRCGSNYYKVNYRNQGTQPTAPSLLRVRLDSHLVAKSSFPTWNQRVGDTLFYHLPSLPVGATGEVTIIAEMDCEAAFPAKTHCTEVHVFPDSLCTPPGVNWDGSSVEVSGNCVGDSVIFKIRNEGLDDMLTPSRYIIVEDLVLHLGGEFQLQAGEELEIGLPSNGKTYRLEANQSEGHPGSSHPSVTIEGCGATTPENFVTGIYGQYPQDDGDPFVAIACTQNDGALPDGFTGKAPAKSSAGQESFVGRVAPRGIGPERLIDPETTLQYHLEFFNRTDAPIRRLVIADTLSPFIAIPSFAADGSSHDYRLSISPTGKLKFTFEHIELLPGESLFIRFSVRLKGNAPYGKIVRNRAGISWGGRAFLAAPDIRQEIRKPQRYGVTTTTSCSEGPSVLPGILRQLDTVRYADYDSVTLGLNYRLPAYAVTFDTTVNRGDTLYGMEILADTEILRRLSTLAGCDSLLTVRVQAENPNSNGDRIEVAPPLLYPNPADDYALLQLPPGGDLRQLTVVNLLGQSHVVPLNRPTGTNGYILDTRQLPPGTYVLQAIGPGAKWTGKLVVRR